jgi:hypothetical protein
MEILWVVMPCWHHLLKAEDGGTTQKATTDIFIAMRTSDLVSVLV